MFLIAVLLRSWKSFPTRPVFLQAHPHAVRKFLIVFPSLWKTEGQSRVGDWPGTSATFLFSHWPRMISQRSPSTAITLPLSFFVLPGSRRTVRASVSICLHLRLMISLFLHPVR